MKKDKKTAKGLTKSIKTLKSTTAESQTSKNGICGTVMFDDVTKIHPALKASLGYCLFKSSALYRTRLEDAIKPLDMNVHHFALLSVLANDKSTNQNQMCDELGIDKASMVKLIDHIEKQKLVERVTCTDDRRVKFVHVTAKGLATLEKARKIRNSIEEKYLEPLTEAEKMTLRSILPRLIEQDKK